MHFQLQGKTAVLANAVAVMPLGTPKDFRNPTTSAALEVGKVALRLWRRGWVFVLILFIETWSLDVGLTLLRTCGESQCLKNFVQDGLPR